MAEPKMAGKTHAGRIPMGVLTALIFVGSVLFYLSFMNPYQAGEAQPLLRGWSYCTRDAPQPVLWPEIDGYIPVTPGCPFTMTRTMTEEVWPASLLIHLDYLEAEIRLGDRVLFSNELDPPGVDKGISDRIVALPQGYTGQDLTVTVSSPYELYSFSPDVIWLGDAGALWARVQGGAAGNMALMIMLATSGLALMVFSLWTRRGWDGFWFGLASVLYGIWLPGQGGAYLGVFPPRLAAQLQYATYHLFAVPMLWFLWMQCRRMRRPMLALAIVYTAAAVSMQAVMLLGLLAPPETLAVMNPAMIGLPLLMFVPGLIEWRERNPFFRLAAPAFVLLVPAAVLSVIDIQGFYTPKDILNVSGILLLVALVWVDILRTYLSHRRRRVEERQMMEMRGQMALEQFEAAARMGHETRLLRHEIRHHLAALSVLQRAGDLEGMGVYLGRLTAQETEQKTVKYCSHPLISAILARTEADCARENIAFTCEADVPPELPIEDGDLASLLLNMLENAVEAAGQPSQGERRMSLRLAQREGFLVVDCRNSRTGPIRREGERFLTTKSDTGRHGYGIAAMHRTAMRCGGTLNIQYDDRSFTVKAMLRLAARPPVNSAKADSAPL